MKKVLKTPNAPKSVGTYNQAIESNNFIFTSGQVGIDPASNKLVEGGLENEINQVLKNIDIILKDSNLEKSHIVKLTVYLIDLNQNLFECLQNLRLLEQFRQFPHLVIFLSIPRHFCLYLFFHYL